jgi:hypothetical protein
MNQTQAAAYLGISAGALRQAVSRGEIEGEHPLSEGPWVFSRAALSTSAARELVQRIKLGRLGPAARAAGQRILDFSST